MIPWLILKWHLRATSGLHQWASRDAPTGHFLATSRSLDSSGRDARNRNDSGHKSHDQTGFFLIDPSNNLLEFKYYLKPEMMY